VLTYASFGVLGTAMTVMLLTLWPTFMVTATGLMWPIFLAAAFSIVLNFVSLAAYWYTYDRIRSSLHMMIGMVVAFSAAFIAFNFRTIMSFTNQAVGLVSTSTSIDPFTLYSNPSLAPLYSHTIFGALSTAGFVVAGGAALWMLRHGVSQEYITISKFGLLAGFLSIVPQAMAGAWYSFTLMNNVPYLFSSITGWAGMVKAQLDLLPLLVAMFVSALLLLSVGALAYTSVKLGRPSAGWLKTMVVMAVLAPSTILIGEALQQYSHLPYFVVGAIEIHDMVSSKFSLDAGSFAASLALLALVMGLVIAVLYVSYFKEEVTVAAPAGVRSSLLSI
jgi:cytochrome d ubiquinol oxidase subunit I